MPTSTPAISTSEQAPSPVPQAPMTGMAADDQVGALFASRSMTEHLLRGVLGLVLIVTAFALAGSTPLTLLLAIPGVVAWRGCPTCWTLGLLATASRGRAGCVDGRCRAD